MAAAAYEGRGTGDASLWSLRGLGLLSRYRLKVSRLPVSKYHRITNPPSMIQG